MILGLGTFLAKSLAFSVELRGFAAGAVALVALPRLKARIFSEMPFSCSATCILACTPGVNLCAWS